MLEYRREARAGTCEEEEHAAEEAEEVSGLVSALTSALVQHLRG